MKVIPAFTLTDEGGGENLRAQQEDAHGDRSPVASGESESPSESPFENSSGTQRVACRPPVWPQNAVSGRHAQTGSDEESSQRRSLHPSPAVASAEDGRRWAENWHANEIRWLHTAIEDLERRLRRRTIALVAALAFSGLLAVVAAGSAVMQRHGPEPPVAVFEAASPPDPSAGSPSVAGKAERASEIEPFQLHRALAVARPNGSGDLDGRGKAVGPEPATEPTGGPAQTGAEQPEHPLELVRRSGSATAAAQDSNAPTRKEAEQQAITGREASTGVEALRAALMATKARIEGLETAGTQHEAQP